MTINVSVADIEVNETDATATFTVNLSGDALTSDLVLNWATSNNASATAATPGSDYVAASGQLTIPVGQTTGTITVSLLDDLVAEGMQYFFVTLTSSDPNVVIPSTRGYTAYAGIIDDEPSVTALDTVTDESAGTVTVTFQLSRPWTSTVTVDYQTTSATASDVAPAATVGNPTPVGDYVAASGTVSFAPGETVKTVTFTVNNDTLVEGREIYAVALSNAVNAYINDSDSRAHIVIEDNDAAVAASPTVNVFGGVVMEGYRSGVLDTIAGATGTAAGAVEFLVLLSAPSAGTVTMNYSTVDGTALAGTDYTATTGTLTFAPGEVAKKVLVPIIDNTTAQVALTRSFGLTVSSLSGATAGISTSNGTIVDNENATLPTASSPLVITAASVGDIIGTAFYDSLVGSSGDDILDGRAKPDTMIGGAGNDIYIFEDSGGTVVENFNQGTDTVITYLNNTQLGTYFENLYIGGTVGLQGVGNNSANLIVGNIGNDSLYAWGGNDTVEGGSGNDAVYGDSIGDITLTGNDSLSGGLGNDTLGGGDGNDTLDGGDGNDLLYGELSAAQDTIGTMTGADSLVGGAGNDTLDGGRGIDTLVGGTGDDVYYVDSSLDVITELTGEGADSVSSSVSYTLSDYVEALTLTGTGNTHATGNGQDNSITGNSGANFIDGGAGADTLVGGTGDDTYYVDSASDVVTELSGGGSDTVRSTITYTLSTYLENLALLGSAAINGTGNASANVLVGNSAGNVLTGDLGNDSLSGGAGADTMIGGAGNDVYWVDDSSDVVTELISEGTDTVNASATFTLSANIEKLILTGSAAIDGTGNTTANIITGNSGSNALSGDAGNDTLDGGAGDDVLTGGTGNDVFYVDSTNDVIVEVAGEGADTVYASATYTLSAYVDNLVLTGAAAIDGTGNGDSNAITGNSGNNQLSGMNGNDTLDGGAGADTMLGGAGDDVYFIDSASDVVTEASGQGSDTVKTTVSYTAGANVENIALLGGAAIDSVGNTLHNVLVGNSAGNTLTGDAGNDSLSGGAGADTMIGGSGNDVYWVDDAGDVITELSAEGTDTVNTSVTYTLSSNVEKLVLSGSSAIDGTGSADNNVLTGNSADNQLFGMGGHDTIDGGAGADTMVGGAGADVYIVDSLGDVVTELVGEGTDTVNTTLTYTLASNVENLNITGSSAADGTGNEGNNTITGNSAGNQLSGLVGNDTLDGGAGADTLIGGTGDDTYVVDSASDVITELAGEGSDTVRSSISYTLGANLENVALQGSTSIGATGNALNNVLIGNGGANVLTGDLGSDSLSGGSGSDTLYGGLGNDLLIGGADVDTFVFNTALNASWNVDTVSDYQAGDRFVLDNDVFSALATTGVLASGNFQSGAGVNGASVAGQVAGIYYDTSTGNLYYDADGFGGASGTLFAHLNGAPTVSNANFIVID